jgi:hypothetical protein
LVKHSKGRYSLVKHSKGGYSLVKHSKGRYSLVKHSKGGYSLVNVVVLFFYQHQTPGIYLILIFNFEYGFHISNFISEQMPVLEGCNNAHAHTRCKKGRHFGKFTYAWLNFILMQILECNVMYKPINGEQKWGYSLVHVVGFCFFFDSFINTKTWDISFFIFKWILFSYKISM